MKKIMSIGVICIIVLSVLSVTSAAELNYDDTTDVDYDCTNEMDNDCCSLINLPSDYVTMVVEYGTESFFDTTLSEVPSCYDVSNGDYLGWCIQRDVYMSRGVLLSIIFYCSYDPDLPEIWQDDDWDKVNYVINHKRGEMMDVQEAIWFFIGEKPPTRPLAIAMIEEANENGEGFCPTPGEAMVVLVDNGQNLDPVVQRSVIEVTVPHEGCTPCFWVICPCCWVGYHPCDKIGDVFDIPDGLPSWLKDVPLYFALFFTGCPPGSVLGAAKLLLKQAVAAILNAAHPKVNYPLTEAVVIDSVNDALASLDPGIILSLKNDLKGYNNLGSDLCCWRICSSK